MLFWLRKMSVIVKIYKIRFRRSLHFLVKVFPFFFHFFCIQPVGNSDSAKRQIFLSILVMKLIVSYSHITLHLNEFKVEELTYLLLWIGSLFVIISLTYCLLYILLLAYMYGLDSLRSFRTYCCALNLLLGFAAISTGRCSVQNKIHQLAQEMLIQNTKKV